MIVEALLKRYVTGPDARPFVESWTLARTVLHTFMQGYEPANGLKKKGETEPEADLTEST